MKLEKSIYNNFRLGANELALTITRHAGLPKIILLALFSLVAVFSTGCSAEEPPMNFGKREPGQMARSTKLLDMDGNVMRHQITYPALGLTSIATVGFRTGVMREEVFEGKWKIVYLYDDTPEIFGIPSTIIVYQFSGGSYNKKINEYKYQDTKPNQIFYQDMNGKVVVRDPSYFKVGSSSMGGPF